MFASQLSLLGFFILGVLDLASVVFVFDLNAFSASEVHLGFLSARCALLRFILFSFLSAKKVITPNAESSCFYNPHLECLKIKQAIPTLFLRALSY